MHATTSGSRRIFLKTAGGAMAGWAGLSAMALGTPAAATFPGTRREPRTRFRGRPATAEDRLERVKLATLGMQRYDWEQGTVAQAFLEMGEYDLAVALARGAILRQFKGRFSVMGNSGPITDCASAGEAVLVAGTLTGDPIFRQGADAMLEVIRTTKHRTADGVIYHTREPARRVMSDATYMLPPFLAAAGEYAEALKQVWGVKQYLYHGKDRLYAHIWDDDTRAFKREAFWGVGNGWCAAGLTRVIRHLPDRMADEKGRLIAHLKDLLDGCLAHLRADGLFHDVVNDPATFPEVNLSQMLGYAIFRGVSAGYLDRAYLKPAARMRQAANERVDALGYVNEVCGLPNFDRPYFAPEAQAFYLLMETAARDLPPA